MAEYTTETKDPDGAKDETKVVDPTSTSEEKMEVETEPKTETTKRKREKKEEKSASSNNLESELSELINDESIAKKLMLLLESHDTDNDQEKSTDKFVTLPVLE